MRSLEEPLAHGARVSERATLVAKQLGFGQRLGQRRTVDFDQRLGGARTLAVKPAGQAGFSRPGFRR